MSRLKQSFGWWCYARNDIKPEELLQAAAEIGYAAVELIGQEYWPLVKQYGLTIASTGGHVSISEGLNRRENHERIEREILKSITLAEKWSIPNLICFSGNRDGLDDATGIEITAEGLRRVAKAAEDAGITLTLELLNSKVDHPDYQCDKTAWGVQVCQLVDSPRVKLLYDIYHMQIMEGDIIRTIRQYHPYFAHYHTAGNPGRNDLDEAQELYYPAIVRTILETEYSGYLTHEFVPKGDVVGALKAAFDLCAIEG